MPKLFCCSFAAGCPLSDGAETELIHPYGGYPAAKLQKYCMSINAGCPATLARAVACICITLVFVRGHRALLPCYMWLATVPRARPEPPSQSRLTLVSTGARIAAKPLLWKSTRRHVRSPALPPGRGCGRASADRLYSLWREEACCITSLCTFAMGPACNPARDHEAYCMHRLHEKRP